MVKLVHLMLKGIDIMAYRIFLLSLAYLLFVCFAWGQTRDSGLVDRDFSIRVM